MRKSTKAAMILTVVVIMSASFMFGQYTYAQQNMQSRQQRCNTLIRFAIDKIETGDLQDPHTMSALVSNIYAAYEYCDDPALAEQLHDVWNMLIFDCDSYIGKEDNLVEILKGIASSVKDEQ